jgi:hypothetical protein
MDWQHIHNMACMLLAQGWGGRLVGGGGEGDRKGASSWLRPRPLHSCCCCCPSPSCFTPATTAGGGPRSRHSPGAALPAAQPAPPHPHNPAPPAGLSPSPWLPALSSLPLPLSACAAAPAPHRCQQEGAAGQVLPPRAAPLCRAACPAGASCVLLPNQRQLLPSPALLPADTRHTSLQPSQGTSSRQNRPRPQPRRQHAPQPSPLLSSQTLANPAQQPP